MPGAQPALGKCEVCGDQLLEIRPFTPRAKVICPTCTEDRMEELKSEVAELKRELREQ